MTKPRVVVDMVNGVVRVSSDSDIDVIVRNYSQERDYAWTIQATRMTPNEVEFFDWQKRGSYVDHNPAYSTRIGAYLK